MSRSGRLGLFAATWIAFASHANGQPFSAEEAAKRMTMPKGFFATPVAGEPLIRQPVAIDFDGLGRLWVLQYLQYPNPEGLKRVKVDRFSRTQYDRVPEPPPRGPKGADKLTILEPDPQRPGQLLAKDFITGLNLATGFAFGQGGVFVLQVPYLLFYPDRNGDDRPDSDPEVLLTGFGMEDAHSVANSLTWGPDGWLYGCQGSTVTANINGIEFQQGVWRYHPLRRKFELFCEGGGNSWGLDFDRHGNLFYSTNHGGFVMLHGVQGGYYWKSFGKHGALHHPFAYGYFDHVPHKNFVGGHVTAGGVVYNGDAYPASFKGQYIAADLLGHGVYSNSIHPNGSSFTSAHALKLVQANDAWFAPCDVCHGPDGCLYVADWHDKRTAHPDPDADWDRSNGRVYRIAFHGTKPRAIPNIETLSTKELIPYLSHPNGWHWRTALRVLAARRDPEAILPLRELFLTSKDEELQLRYFWACGQVGGLSDFYFQLALRHENEDIRGWAVRLLGDEDFLPSELGKEILDLAKRETSVRVRAQLAATARRLEAKIALPLLSLLLQQKENAKDPHIPLLLWWSLEKFSQSHAEAVIAITKNRLQSHPLEKEILPRLVRRYAAEGTEDGPLIELLGAKSEKEASQLAQSISLGLEQRDKSLKPSGRLLQKTNELASRFPQSMPCLILLVRWGDKEAISNCLNLLQSKTLSPQEQATLLQALGEAPNAADFIPLFSLNLNASTPDPIQAQSIRSLQQVGTMEAGKSLLGSYGKVSNKSKSLIRLAMLGKKEWALWLLEEVDKKKILPVDFSQDELRIAAIHGDEKIIQEVRKHWGTIRERTPEERLADVRRLNNDLRAGSGNTMNGKALYTRHCASCHKYFGEGIALGPDLTTSNRLDRDFLLVSLVDPGSIIRKEYMNYLIELKDGRVLTGMIVENREEGIVVANAKNERVTVRRDKIALLQELEVSLMPADLWKELKPQELRDLFNYLQLNLEKGSKP